MNEIAAYKRSARSLAQLVSLAMLYRLEHPMVRTKTKEVYKELTGFMAAIKKSIVLTRSADIFFINGEKIDTNDKMMARFVEDFAVLQIGSIELEPGLTEKEFDAFVAIICRKNNIIGTDTVKKFLAEEKISHVIAHAATFKLVRDDENIIKKGSFIKMEDLPPGIVDKFSKDLTEGRVAEGLKKEGDGYKAAAHNPIFLAGLASDFLKGKESPQDLEKVLWFLADYLIDEISTGREEEINRKVLENVKERLISAWRDKPEKKHMTDSVEKTYTVINAALQLKGLLALYKKHKKEIETTVVKIKKIFKDLPSDSRLYQKTKRDIMDTGLPSLDQDIFR